MVTARRHFFSVRRALCTAALAVAAVLGSLPLPASTGHAQDLQAIRGAMQADSREVERLATAVERQLAENARIEAQLGTATAAMAAPTLEELRQAQFEVDIGRTKILNLKSGIEVSQAEIAALDAMIVRDSAAEGAEGDDTLQTVINEAALQLRRERKAASEDRLIQLNALLAASETSVSWREEQLSLLQQAANLEALVQGGPGGRSATLQRLSALIDSLVLEAITLSNEATGIADDNPAAIQRRNTLRVLADELALRSNARFTDIAIVQTRMLVDGLRPLLQEKAIPTRLFGDAATALTDADERLAARSAVIGSIRTATRDLSLVFNGTQSASRDEIMGRLTRLGGLLETQEKEIADLRAATEELRGDIARERAARDRATLFTRARARTDRLGRERIIAEFEELPGEISAIYSARVREVRTALEVASSQSIAAFAAAIAILILTVLWLRLRLLKRFVEAEATRATAIPLEVLRRNLFWLLPPAIWVAFAAYFAISRTTAIQVGMLLSIPAAAAFAQDLTTVIVAQRGTGTRGIGRVIVRATGVALVLTTMVVFAFVVLDEVPLLPSTQLAINRLAYSVFVLSGLPLLLFVLFFAQPAPGDSAMPVRRVVSALIALVPPIAILATGVAGLAGYTNLAAVMLEDLAIAIVIVLALALLLGVVNDSFEGVAQKIRDNDPARAYFVRQNFLDPAKRILQLILTVVAIAVAGRIFAWSRDTVGISDFLQFWNETLFTVGEAPYTVGSVVVALAAFVFVFWLAAWSRRVAYSVFLRKLKDVGIRQSLSVFAQYVVIVLGVLLTLSAIGFDVTTLTVFAASLGVGIGFGLQNVVNNFISGLLLLVERPLRIGDIVTVGGTSGTVSQIGIRSMRMRTFDEFDLIVPNSALVSDTFTNWTRSNSLMRVVLTVGISYADPPQKAIDTVTKVLEDHPGIVASPAPLVTLDEFGDSSVNLRVCYYGDLRGNYSLFEVRSEVLTTIIYRFAAEGLSIPFPQRDVHMIEPQPARDVGPAPEPKSARAPNEDWRGDAVEMADEGSKDTH